MAIYLLLAGIAGALLLLAVALTRPDPRDEVARFHRARALTTEWARQGPPTLISPDQAPVPPPRLPTAAPPAASEADQVYPAEPERSAAEPAQSELRSEPGSPAGDPVPSYPRQYRRA